MAGHRTLEVQHTNDLSSLGVVNACTHVITADQSVLADLIGLFILCGLFERYHLLVLSKAHSSPCMLCLPIDTRVYCHHDIWATWASSRTTLSPLGKPTR